MEVMVSLWRQDIDRGVCGLIAENFGGASPAVAGSGYVIRRRSASRRPQKCAVELWWAETVFQVLGIVMAIQPDTGHPRM